MILFPNCKINLGLHILQKRTDGYHNLETVFYPIPLQDALEIIQSEDNQAKDVELSITGLSIDATEDENVCVKAYKLLQKDFPLPSVKIHLHKVIPTGAGLGGGSADGAFTLLLLNKKFNLGIPQEQLIQYALQLGSDCPFFIVNKPCLATGRGEQLQPLELDLSAHKIVLVHPDIHINTGWAFSQVRPQKERPGIADIVKLPVSEWKDRLINDFEEPVFHHHPAIRSLKETLYQKGARYAAMSGSGSTVFGLFDKTSVPDLDFPPTYFVQQFDL